MAARHYLFTLGAGQSGLTLYIMQRDTAAATAFGIFLLRQSFLGVPVELEEAARCDGCTPLGEWWNVMIPAARADLITLAMFVFIGTWSDFLWPLVAAGAVISILPVLVVFIGLQRYILPSAAGDAVKG